MLLAAAEQVISLNCISDDNNYTTQNFGHSIETISVNFVQENSDTNINNRSNGSKNNDFPAIIATQKSR